VSLRLQNAATTKALSAPAGASIRVIPPQYSRSTEKFHVAEKKDQTEIKGQDDSDDADRG
jgi:hypothetical protein